MLFAVLLCLTLCTAGCSPDQDGIGEADIEFHRVTEAPLQQDTTEEDSVGMNPNESTAYTADTKIADVQSDPVFGAYGRLIFPVDEGDDPPTCACVGTSDGIANWRTMQARLDAMAALGIPTEFHAYEGLSHGFGLGTGTVAEGWITDAVAFWEKQVEE